MKTLLVLAAAAAAGVWGTMEVPADPITATFAPTPARPEACAACQSPPLVYSANSFPLADYR